jgi:hypothetical protein
MGSCQYPCPQHVTAHGGYGAYFRTAITGTTISFVGYAFVDDTDLCITGQNPHDTEADVAPNAASVGLMGRRDSSYWRRNCPGEVSLVRTLSILNGSKEIGDTVRDED